MYANNINRGIVDIAMLMLNGFKSNRDGNGDARYLSYCLLYDALLFIINKIKPNVE